MTLSYIKIKIINSKKIRRFLAHYWPIFVCEHFSGHVRIKQSFIKGITLLSNYYCTNFEYTYLFICMRKYIDLWRQLTEIWIIYFLQIQAEATKYRGIRAYLQKVQITQNNVTNEISLSRPINSIWVVWRQAYSL